jgi:6-phospho-beta-glucosidase
MSRKIGFLGGGGVRTPLVVFGIREAARELDAEELVLFDVDQERAKRMAQLGREVVRRDGGTLRLRVASSQEEAVDGASFVLNSVRVGGMEGRARDERSAIECGYPGQETTGPAGVAMGQRTIPVAIAQARMVAARSPDAWLINFTNPAGLITQAILQHSEAKAVGICDTPTEMLHRIRTALNATAAEVDCDYVGLNHLGWVRRIRLRGEDVTERVLNNDEILSQLYSAPLFDHELIRALRMLPTEYLFFYYSRTRALANQRRQGSTRGEQIGQMNESLMAKLMALLARNEDGAALQAYVDYLNLRSGSYMKLEGEGESAFDTDVEPLDPFRAATGYHRIALDVMLALCSKEGSRAIVNVRNRGAVADIDAEDVIETTCDISDGSISPIPMAPLPESVRGLVLSVKAYERSAIHAAISGSRRDLRKAMLLYPAIAEWEPSEQIIQAMHMER